MLEITLVVGEELKPPGMRLEAKAFLQEKAINDVTSEVKEQLHGECCLGTQLFNS